jgi:uncharacterized protein YcbX
VPPSLKAIARYPVKSCRGEALQKAVVEPWGLRGDRRWMIVDATGTAVTAREVPRLVLVRPEFVDGGLRLSAPGRQEIVVPTPQAHAALTVDVWGARLQALTAGAQADAWVSGVVGAPARLVYLDDPTQRQTDPARTKPGDRVSFADGYPLLLTNTASLETLNDHIAAGPRAGEGPLPMTRFRPSLVVDGAPAWTEDDWRLIRIGQVQFRVVKGCDRCVLTTIDPDTAAGGHEPIATLARHRQWDGRTWFGINLVPDSIGSVDVGAELEVLDAVDPGYGPLR